MKKLFILDTNVLLHDPTSIYKFEENDVVIPILVLEELDRFKKGNDWINLASREFIRILSELSENNKSATQMALGEGKGELYIEIDGYSTESESPIFFSDTTDNKLLALCLNLKKTNTAKAKKNRYKSIVFVTKDINLRIKARALDIEAQDYKNDKVADSSNLYKGFRVISDLPSEAINMLYSGTDGVSFSDYSDYIDNPVPNEFFLLKNGKHSALAKYESRTNSLQKIMEQEVAGLKPRNLEQIFAIDLLLNSEIPLVALTGTSGAGKTLLALASAIAQKRDYHQIFLARPVVPVGNDIGYLPGDIEEKLAPYMQPLWDNLEIVKKESKSEKTITEMLQNEKIKIIALPYLRGRSLPKIFFIIDEIQNLTPHEVKTIVTRAGEGAKIVLTGDLNQIDSPYLDTNSNGLSYLIHKMKGQELFGHVHLSKGERSKLAEITSNTL